MAVGWVLGVGILLYLFLIAPGRRCRKCRGKIHQRFFAHRGLQNAQAPENSLTAFRLAAERGFGIELDVRLTRDEQIVVHHDPRLLRLCGVDAAVSDLTLDELRQYRLIGSGEGIPTLREVCSAVCGRVPLLIEMKYERGNEKLAPLLLREMASYRGVWYVESFDPRKLFWFRRYAPQVIRGQLANDPKRGDVGERGVIPWMGAHLLMNALSRPDFIAYGFEGDRNPTFSLVRFLFRPVTAAWTVKRADDCRRLMARYDLLIFEGFNPDAISSEEKETVK